MTPIVRSAHISCKAPPGAAANDCACAESVRQQCLCRTRTSSRRANPPMSPASRDHRSAPSTRWPSACASRAATEPLGGRRCAAVAAIHTTDGVRQVFWKSAVHPPPYACGRIPQSTSSRRRFKSCTRPSGSLLDCWRDWFLVGGSESSDGRKLPAVTEAVTFSRLRKIPGWEGQPEDIRWRPRPPVRSTACMCSRTASRCALCST